MPAGCFDFALAAADLCADGFCVAVVVAAGLVAGLAAAWVESDWAPESPCMAKQSRIDKAALRECWDVQFIIEISLPQPFQARTIAEPAALR